MSSIELMSLLQKRFNVLPKTALDILSQRNKTHKLSGNQFLIRVVENSVKATTVLEASLKQGTIISNPAVKAFFSQSTSYSIPKVVQQASKYYSYLEALTKLQTALSPQETSPIESHLSFIQMEYDLLNPTNAIENIDLREGQRIVTINESQRIRKIIQDIFKDNSKLFQINARQFEELIAELLTGQGLKVELTKQTRDGGYDILAIHHMVNHSPQKWLVECKRFTNKKKVGVEIIRSFKEVIQAECANKGIIATTSYFSADAKRKREKTPYLLDFRDKDAIIDWIIDYNNQRV